MKVNRYFSDSFRNYSSRSLSNYRDRSRYNEEKCRSSLPKPNYDDERSQRNHLDDDEEKNGKFFLVSFSKEDGKWQIREINSQTSETFSSKGEAIIRAQDYARKEVKIAHVVIYTEDGGFESIENF